MDLLTKMFNVNGEWREIVKDDSGLIPLSRNCSNNYSGDAKVVQDIFCNYFNSPEGAVPWQLTWYQ